MRFDWRCPEAPQVGVIRLDAQVSEWLPEMFDFAAAAILGHLETTNL